MRANREIIAGLEKLKKKHMLEGDKMRVKAYGGAISALKDIKTPFKQLADLHGIKGVGKSILEKAREYFT